MYTIIRRFNADCPLCEREHTIEERQSLATITIKGQKVEYIRRYYFCENTDNEENEFETGSMVNKNLQRARAAYEHKTYEVSDNDKH